MVMQVKTSSGYVLPVPGDNHGHPEVAIHSPRLPFGSILTESLTPIFQYDAVYGLSSEAFIQTVYGSGSVGTSDSAFYCSTGTTIYSAGALQTAQRLIYRPGQGIIGRFTALFTEGVANSYQVAGYGHAEDGIYFAYKGVDFGILYNNRGVREVQTLTINTASSTAENITVTLGGTAYSIAVTASGSTTKTAYEISEGSYTGWRAEQIDSTVIFIANDVGNKTGTFSIAGTTAAGTFAETKAGAAAEETFIPQSDWNGDKCDGTGVSKFVADWTKFNVFEIQIQYLGAGALVFKMEVPHEGNNPDFITVHSINIPNAQTRTSFGNPNFPFTMSAYSAGSTTNLTVKSGSFIGAIEGVKKVHGNRYSYQVSSNAVTSSAYKALYTIRNTRYYGGRANQSVVKLLSINAALKHNFPCTIYIFKNATLEGSPDFEYFDSESCTAWDFSATNCTITNNRQLIWSGSMGDTGNIARIFDSIDDEILLNPGDTLTIAARTSSGSASYVVASVNTKEYT